MASFPNTPAERRSLSMFMRGHASIKAHTLSLITWAFFAHINSWGALGSGHLYSELHDRHDELQHVRSCGRAFGPWPQIVPHGSATFNDGAHTNISTLAINFADSFILGIQGKYLDMGTSASSTPLKLISFSHGSSQGSRKATFHYVKGGGAIEQVGGSYDEKGLNALLLVDSNDNQYAWGKDAGTLFTMPKFLTPKNVGYLVGFFGAANESALTQIGVCFSG